MRNVLITGCSSGFGLLTALEFARIGDRVFAGVRDLASAHRLRAAADDEDLSVAVVELDITRPESVDACIAHVTDTTGTVDVVVNNAGIASFAAVEDTNDDLARQILETNVLGPLRVSRAVLPQMREQGRGHIIMVSSVNGFIGLPFTGIYSASKFALEALAEAIAFEEGQLGVMVSIVQPGPYHTQIDEKLAVTTPSEAFPGMADMVAAGRHAMASDRPEEVALAIVACTRAERPPMRVQVGTIAEQLYQARRAMEDDVFYPHLVSMFAG